MSACYVLYDWNGELKWQELTNYGWYLVDPAHVAEFRSQFPNSRLVPINANVF
ncbi:MAG TPA: hypothetical protein VN521_01980 [Negativicutes bacterium]|nr:hypothetical protein [Negativicutes bacterium]